MVSHGAPVAGIQVFGKYTSGNKCKQIEPTIFTQCYMPVYLHTQNTVHGHLTNHTILIAEKAKYPQREPNGGIKMVQVLGSADQICGFGGNFWIWCNSVSKLRTVYTIFSVRIVFACSSIELTPNFHGKKGLLNEGLKMFHEKFFCIWPPLTSVY